MPSQPKKRAWSNVSLRELVDEVAQSLAPQCKEQAVEMTLDIPSALTVFADRELLRRAIEHLLRNALAAMPQGGSLLATSAAGFNAVELEIADTGPTLSDEARRCIFAPSGTAERGASAWQLAMVRRIAEIHDGSVTAANCPEGGVALTLRIPRPAALEAAA